MIERAYQQDNVETLREFVYFQTKAWLLKSLQSLIRGQNGQDLRIEQVVSAWFASLHVDPAQIARALIILRGSDLTDPDHIYNDNNDLNRVFLLPKLAREKAEKERDLKLFALHWSAEQDDVELVDQMLKWGARADELAAWGSDTYNGSAFLSACRTGSVAVIDYFLSNNHSIVGLDGYRSATAHIWPPLHLAAALGHVQVVERLLSYAADGGESAGPVGAQSARVRALLTMRDIRGNTPLHVVCDFESKESSDKLDFSSFTEQEFEHFCQRRADIAAILLQSGSDLHALNNYNETPFQYFLRSALYREDAIANFSLRMLLPFLRLLVERGSDVNRLGPTGRRTLEWLRLLPRSDQGFWLSALILGSERLKVGLRAPNPDNPDTDEMTHESFGRMVRAIGLNDPSFSRDEVLAELDRNPQLIGIDSLVSGYTLLQVACRSGNEGLVAELLDRGASVRFQGVPFDMLGYNQGLKDMKVPPLYHALQAASLPVVTLLLNAGADINQRLYYLRNNGVVMPGTMLHKACYDHDRHSARLLLAHGASLLVRDLNGQTPLHLAFARGFYMFDLVYDRPKELGGGDIAVSAALKMRNNKGDTPFHILCRQVNSGKINQDHLVRFVAQIASLPSHRSFWFMENLDGHTPWSLLIGNADLRHFVHSLFFDLVVEHIANEPVQSEAPSPAPANAGAGAGPLELPGSPADAASHDLQGQAGSAVIDTDTDSGSFDASEHSAVDSGSPVEHGPARDEHHEAGSVNSVEHGAAVDEHSMAASGNLGESEPALIWWPQGGANDAPDLAHPCAIQ